MKNKTKSTIKQITEIAVGTAIITICSWITVPFAIPFTMQTFAVFAILIILGGKCGLASIGAYILLGITGVPVFSGFTGGIGHITGPTGGYIIGFVLTGILYMLFDPYAKKGKKQKYIILSAGLILCYTVGTLWFAFTGNTKNVLSVLVTCVLPYIIPDIIKMILAVSVGDRIRTQISE